jgi:hypothetical protein
MVRNNHKRSKIGLGECPDLHTQLESLLDAVWWCERLWKLEDRIEAASEVWRKGVRSNGH